jgi:hypothetical protein
VLRRRCAFLTNRSQKWYHAHLSASYELAQDDSDVNFDHMVKVIFARHFHCKAIIFPLGNRYILKQGRYSVLQTFTLYLYDLVYIFVGIPLYPEHFLLILFVGLFLVSVWNF